MPPVRCILVALFALVLTACPGNRTPPPPPPNVDLAALTLSAGTLSPPFDPEIVAYTAIVEPAVGEVSVAPVAANASASVNVNGILVQAGAVSTAQALLFGDNTIVIVVTFAPTAKTYTVTVTRPQQPVLSDLAVSPGALTPAFDPLAARYAVRLPFLELAVRVTATVADADATITVNDEAVVSGQPGGAIALPEGNTLIVVRVTDAQGRSRDYFVAVTRESVAAFAQQAYVKASNTGASDEFGYAVAIDGDTLAVGAYREDSNATGIGGNQNDNSASNSGAVYVFRRVQGAWTQEAYVKASNTEAGDFFGLAVALHGDTLAVGAYLEDSNATGIGGNQADNSAQNSGAVYVFTRAGTTWTQQAYVKASNTDAGDGFGVSVAVAGELLAVGAYLEDSAAVGIGGNQGDNSAIDSGAAYVFTRSEGTWTQVVYVKASNTQADDLFGLRVALAGQTLAASAFQEDSAATGIDGDQADNSASNSGAVYVFANSDGTWSQQAYVKASNTGASDQFGIGVALDGDTLVVGANQEDSAATGIDGNQGDNSAANSGAAYVFTRSGSVWSQQAYVKASNTGAGDEFGLRVAVSGEALAAGAPFEDSNATGVHGGQGSNSAPGSGAVYLFLRTAGPWAQQAYVKASNTESGDQFGLRVALAGNTLVVGAAGEDSATTGVNGGQSGNGAPGSGAVYVLR